MPKRPSYPAHLIGNAFRSGDDGHRLSPSQLRNRDVQHFFRGTVSMALDPTSIVDLCVALRPRLQKGDAFSHTTAATLLQAPLPARFDQPLPLHVTSRRLITGVGIEGHRATIMPPTTRALGLPVVDSAAVWCQLSTLLGADDLVAVGDYLVSPRRGAVGRLPPLTGLADLRSAAAEHGRRRGSRALRGALGLVRIGPESRRETLLRLALLRAGLPEPVIHHPIPLSGGWTAHPDLAYPQWRIAIEYEGDGHRTDREQWRRDLRRYELMQDAGWRVIRVHSNDLRNSSTVVVTRIRRLMAA